VNSRLLRFSFRTFRLHLMHAVVIWCEIVARVTISRMLVWSGTAREAKVRLQGDPEGAGIRVYMVVYALPVP
jgi:hypothetical protein